MLIYNERLSNRGIHQIELGKLASAAATQMKIVDKTSGPDEERRVSRGERTASVDLRQNAEAK